MDFPLPEHGLPGLEPLLRGDLWSRWVDASRVFPVDDLRRSVGYLRLKPATSCRLTVIASVSGKGERPPEGFLLHLYPDLERARTAYAKLTRREAMIGEEGWEPFLDEESCTVAAPFPNDPELPSLRQVYDPTRFRRLLSKTRPRRYPRGEWRLQKRHIRTELLAYKPGRRAVFRARVGVRHLQRDEKVRLYWHIKATHAAAATRIHERADALHTAVGDDRDWRVPEPWGFSEHRSWVANEWVMGTPLARSPEQLAAVGRALAELHRLPIAPSGPLGPAFSSAREAASLTSLAGDLAHLLPEEGPAIRDLCRRVSERLAALEGGPAACLHGDFHHDQLVVEEETGRLVIIDLDEAGCGPAAVDLGSFRASRFVIGGTEAEDDALLRGYEEVGALGDPEHLRTATALQLLRRAVFPFRSLSPDWPDEVRARIAEAERVLQDG